MNIVSEKHPEIIETDRNHWNNKNHALWWANQCGKHDNVLDGF